MRLFISVAVSHTVALYAKTIQDTIRSSQAIKATYVHPHLFHITLAFLGEVPDECVPTLIDTLKTIHAAPAFAMLSSLSTPIGPSPKHIWLEVSSPGLEELAHTLSRTLSLAPSKPLRLHITLARIKQLYAPELLEAVLRQIKCSPLTWAVTSFMLKKSVLTTITPEYYTIAHYILRD